MQSSRRLIQLSETWPRGLLRFFCTGCFPLCLIIGCDDNVDAAGRSRDSAGIAIVENPGTDRPLTWQLDHVVDIGATEGGIELNQLIEYTVDADTMGHIFILDQWYGQRVQVVDTTGALIRTLTRAGAGPGELGAGISVSAGGDGTVAVMDFSKGGIVRIRHDGTVLPSILLPGYGLFGGARVDGDTVVLHTIDLHSPTWQELVQYRTDSDSVTLTVFRPRRLSGVRLCRDYMDGLTPMLSPELRWTARGSRVAVTKTAAYEIELFSGPHLRQIVKRRASPVHGDADAVRRSFPDGKVVGSPDCTLSATDLVDRRGVAPVIQPVRRLAIDLEGRLWAERNTFPDEEPRVDVFTRAGAYLGTLAGFGAPLAFPATHLVVFARADSTLRGGRLAIFRLKRSGAPEAQH